MATHLLPCESRTAACPLGLPWSSERTCDLVKPFWSMAQRGPRAGSRFNLQGILELEKSSARDGTKVN
jgi:hypothetical protein